MIKFLDQVSPGHKISISSILNTIIYKKLHTITLKMVKIP